MWQSIPYVTTGLGLVAFAIAGILYYLRYQLKQRANIIKSASPKDRIEAIAATAEQFRVDITGLSSAKRAEIVLEQIAIRRRRDLLATIIILSIAGLLTSIAIVAIVSSLGGRDAKVELPPKLRQDSDTGPKTASETKAAQPPKPAQQPDIAQPPRVGQEPKTARVFGSVVTISSGGTDASFCTPRAVVSCVTPEHGGTLVPRSGNAVDIKVTDQARASWNVVRDGPHEICVEFRVFTAACEMRNTLTGRASAVEQY